MLDEKAYRAAAKAWEETTGARRWPGALEYAIEAYERERKITMLEESGYRLFYEQRYARGGNVPRYCFLCCTYISSGREPHVSPDHPVPHYASDSTPWTNISI